MNWGPLALALAVASDLQVYQIIVILNGIGAGIATAGDDAARRAALIAYIGGQPAGDPIPNPQGTEIRNLLGIPAPTPAVIPPPAAPVVQQPHVTQGSIELSWAEVATALEYLVYGRTHTQTYALLGTVPTGEHLFVDVNVRPGETKRYYVVAVGASGNSPASNIVTGTPPAPPQQRPQQRNNTQGGWRDFFRPSL